MYCPHFPYEEIEAQPSVLKSNNTWLISSTMQRYIRSKELINTNFSSMSPDIAVGEQEMFQEAFWPSPCFFHHLRFYHHQHQHSGRRSRHSSGPVRVCTSIFSTFPKAKASV